MIREGAVVIIKRLLLVLLIVIMGLSVTMCAPSQKEIERREAIKKYNYEKAKWLDSLVQTAKIAQGWKGTQMEYKYECPPRYHLIKCPGGPTCLKDVVTERIRPGAMRRNPITGQVEMGIEEYHECVSWAPCDMCGGTDKMCEPDGATKPKYRSP
jgi:hypothetical protein